MTVSNRPRFFVEVVLARDAVLELPPAASRHVQVLRLQPGNTVALFNDAGDLEWAAEVIAIGRKAVTVRIGEPQRVANELPLRVHLAVAIPANERMDGLVEKATELGVAGLQPLMSERSVVRLSGERGAARRRHWSAVAAAACEQCGRVRIPVVAEPIRIDVWLRRLDAPVAAAAAAAAAATFSHRFLLSFNEQARAPTALLRRGTDNAPAEIVVLSGPEGGLAPAEEALAMRCGFMPVSLGPLVLRADTAPLALLAWLGIAIRSDPP